MRKTFALLGATAAVLCVACSQDVKVIEIDPMKIEFRLLDESTELRVRGLNAKGAPADVGGAFTFSSESPSIADVSSSGVVTPKGNGDTAIIATAPNGVKGEVFVSVCLPKELVCEPKEQLDIRVSTGAPIKCHVLNCREEIIENPVISFDVLAKNVAVPDKAAPASKKGVIALPVTGGIIGETEATVTAYNFEKKIHIKVEEALPIPGEEEYLKGQKGGKKGGGNDPYSSGKGGFGHILSNMKFN
jgi:hypothetical protein